MKHKQSIILYIILLVFTLPSTAHAYIDPGTGSLLLSIIVSIFATGLFFIKGLIYKVKTFYYKLTGRKYLQKTKGLVFYSEGGQYWNVFKPIISALNERGESCIYLTSDENDLGLQHTNSNFTSHYIGKGNRAYMQLNMLEADVCIMTTPGLDVYQLRRSPGVKHYAHVVHQPGDVFYRCFGLDYYDSVLTSGPHQERFIRIIESQRNIVPKLMLHSGCAYYDVLMENKKAFDTQVHVKNTTKNILVAPTWGVNGLLTRYGMSLLKPLIDAQYNVTIRPHPQSLMVEQDLVRELQEQTSAFANVSWDSSADNFATLSKADVLISDYSGVIFDFSFVFERPVLTLDFEPNLLPYDAHNVGERPWQFTVQEKIGRKITLEDIQNIPAIIEKMLDNDDFVSQLRSFRDSNVYNFGNSGNVIASQILDIKRSVQTQGQA